MDTNNEEVEKLRRERAKKLVVAFGLFNPDDMTTTDGNLKSMYDAIKLMDSVYVGENYMDPMGCAMTAAVFAFVGASMIATVNAEGKVPDFKTARDVYFMFAISILRNALNAGFANAIDPQTVRPH